jgi:hypothetical protein
MSHPISTPVSFYTFDHLYPSLTFEPATARIGDVAPNIGIVNFLEKAFLAALCLPLRKTLLPPSRRFWSFVLHLETVLDEDSTEAKAAADFEEVMEAGAERWLRRTCLSHVKHSSTMKNAITLPVLKCDMLFVNGLAPFHARVGLNDDDMPTKRDLIKMYLGDLDQGWGILPSREKE